MIGRLVLLLLPLSLMGCASSTPVITDAAVVYCAVPVRQSQTVEAAVALRLVDSSSTGNSVAVDGITHTFEEWRDKRRTEFDKACKAVAEPQMRPAATSALPTWATLLISFLAAALGAVLSWFLTNQKDQRNRRQQHAVVLRTAGDEFVSAMYAYRDAQLKGDSPADTDLRAKRDRLSQPLAVDKHLRPAWHEVDVVQTDLAAVFTDATETPWRFSDHKEELRPRADRLTGASEVLDRRIAALASSLERPRRAKTLLNAKFPSAVTG